MASTFPSQIDNIPSFLDVTERDGELIKKFEEYMQKNDFANATNILNQIEDADRKIISANRMNMLRNCIIALENFYGTDIVPYIDNKQAQWQGIIDQFKYIGSYNSSTSYKINNIISYQYLGDYNLYIRIDGDNQSNQPPTDERYWRILTIKGERGIPTQGETVFFFEWKSNQKYPINSIVSDSNRWWIALKENTNSQPTEGNSNWQMIMNSMQALYPISKDRPLSQAIGELWFEVI